MQENELVGGIFAIDLALWIEKAHCLVLADFHLGFEEMMNKQGVLLPRANFKAIKRRLERRVFSKVKPELIVINGDLKHEFGSISQQEWREVIEMLEFLEKHCKKIVLVQGNHDRILGPLAKWRNLKLVKGGYYIKENNILVVHGDQIPESEQFKKAKTVIIGHEHPAVSIREGVKSEKSKCFLLGNFMGKNLIVQPSLNSLYIGSDILKEQLLSPFLKQPLDEFECWVVEDKLYYFGKLKDLK